MAWITAFELGDLGPYLGGLAGIIGINEESRPNKNLEAAGNLYEE